MAVDPLALSNQRPGMSASVPVTFWQKTFIVLVSLGVLALAVMYPWTTAKSFVLISTLFYLAYSFYKLLLLRLSVSSTSAIEISKESIDSVHDDDWPIYSVLVPMYMEPEVVPHLVKALDELDYPSEKKDIQLLLEEDDESTIKAVERITLPEGFRVTLIPESFPRTKPKACNIGLAEAKGKYLVIYDAEDRPEPDQLKKAVIAFNRVPDDVVCLQSKLNFYNPRHNLLTRWFTAEYSAWYDLSLPGLSTLEAVIPLGGTSNHFVTGVLRDMLGWDAHNVTEDCDLGVRICRDGYYSRILDTTTWEEACSDLKFWIRQRTRWLKGYMQTYFVHMRNPFRLLMDLGFINFLHFQILIGGTVFSFLINPLFWFLALLWFTFRLEILTSLFPVPVFAMGALCLFAGNFAFVYMSAAGCYRRGYFDLVKYTLITPFYWMMMSYSGWRAFLQFFSDPFYWEKTQHGLTEQE